MSFFKNKSVLITGHTGFKGAWLAEWLLADGAEVHGLSNEVVSTPSLFEILKHSERLKSHRLIDVRDSMALNRHLSLLKPEIVFHMAAQALVRPSYDDPIKTFETNVNGTLHILEAIRKKTIQPKSTVIVTTDKCYLNNETGRPFLETDPLGGKDPYSASKACAEIVTHSYIQSFFGSSSTHIATARAGNVVGGQDWSADRLIPDCLRSWKQNESVTVRAPHAIRPWQFVLEPLYGYRLLAQSLFENSKHHGEAFNFGPATENEQTVEKVVFEAFKHYSKKISNTFEPLKIDISQVQGKKESQYLKLSHEKAVRELQWKPRLGFSETLSWTLEGYTASDIQKTVAMQISNFQGL